MSQAKIETVKKSRKDQGACGKCKEELPVGSAYLYFYVGFRSPLKRVRCMKPGCFPKPSERESSMVADIYAAQEAFEDQIDSLESWEDIRAALDEVVSAANEVADQYESAAEDANGNVFNQDNIDRADNIRAAAEELENLDAEADTTECESCGGSGEIADGEVAECGTCDGTGSITKIEPRPEGGVEVDVECPDCAGSGGEASDAEPCSDCDGSGQVPDIEGMREKAREAVSGMELP